MYVLLSLLSYMSTLNSVIIIMDYSHSLLEHARIVKFKFPKKVPENPSNCDCKAVSYSQLDSCL